MDSKTFSKYINRLIDEADIREAQEAEKAEEKLKQQWINSCLRKKQNKKLWKETLSLETAQEEALITV